MKPIDYLKAVGAGLAVMALNLLLSVPVILICRFVIFTGRDAAFYDALPMKAAPWSSWIGGPLIFFALMGLLAARRPDRNGLLFAGVAWTAYLAIDLASSFGHLAAMLTPTFAVTMAIKLAAALAGSWAGSRLAQRRTTP